MSGTVVWNDPAETRDRCGCGLCRVLNWGIPAGGAGVVLSFGWADEGRQATEGPTADMYLRGLCACGDTATAAAVRYQEACMEVA